MKCRLVSSACCLSECPSPSVRHVSPRAPLASSLYLDALQPPIAGGQRLEGVWGHEDVLLVGKGDVRLDERAHASAADFQRQQGGRSQRST